VAELALDHAEIARLRADRGEVARLARERDPLGHQGASLLEVAGHLRRHGEDMHRVAPSDPVRRAFGDLECLAAEPAGFLDVRRVARAEGEAGPGTPGGRGSRAGARS